MRSLDVHPDAENLLAWRLGGEFSRPSVDEPMNTESLDVIAII